MYRISLQMVRVKSKTSILINGREKRSVWHNNSSNIIRWLQEPVFMILLILVLYRSLSWFATNIDVELEV